MCSFYIEKITFIHWNINICLSMTTFAITMNSSKYDEPQKIYNKRSSDNERERGKICSNNITLHITSFTCVQ